MWLVAIVLDNADLHDLLLEQIRVYRNVVRSLHSAIDSRRS